MKKTLLILILLSVILALSWFFLKPADATAATGDASSPVAQVQVTTMHRQTLTRQVSAFGVIASAVANQQTITAAYDCVVRRINVVPGSPVAAGDLLLEIAASPDAQLVFEAARRAQTQAAAALAVTQERFDLKLATRQELLAAQQADLQARQRLASFQTRGLGGNGELRASVAGVVSRIEVGVGTQVSLGVPLLTMSLGSSREARLAIEVTDAETVLPGQTAILWPANRREASGIAATVAVVGRLSDAVTGTVEVRATLPANAALLLGEHVQALIAVQSTESLVVPRSAVLPEGDKRVLYTVAAGQAVRHEVALGLVEGDWAGVSGPDLQPGEVVVTQGNYELEAGMAVQVLEAQP